MTNSTPHTAYHARYFAYELTCRHPSCSQERLTSVLQDAQVDLNPHQVDAAHFAIKSPLGKGALLADEVGLGKTIEAGIILSQKWAEGSRRLLIICPANLRKQWVQELFDKFFLPSVILENHALKGISAQEVANIFQQDKIIICSYQFAQSRAEELKAVRWDMVVIDEAHRLRNVYRPDNKIGNAIKRALKDDKKILLTATPFQNSLSELYGLVSLIDDYVFGDYNSFKVQYSRVDSQKTFDSLKERLSPICHRTLRRQVQEYINYTKRMAMVVEFYPYEQEMELYYGVSNYLSRPKLYALPNSQRHLMTLILRKLLASSSFALQGTFAKLAERLQGILRGEQTVSQPNFSENYEDLNNLTEEWQSIEEVDKPQYNADDYEAIRDEIEELQRFATLADSIENNSKGDKMITALEKGFDKLKELGAPQKAIIFTESTRTQAYILKLLAAAGYGDKTVLFSGTNNDAQSREIYNVWLRRHKGTDKISGSKSADMRQAIIDYFREEAQIMVATEAAAEGVNLQFCSLVMNYDLPWNPQRIEQRIGRCHRYGQKYDVVVINFLNKENAADQRVYKLLDEKFQLFNGVFGASDEILGAIEEGVDFEKRIAEIYQTCRTREEIEVAFDELQELCQPEIDKTMSLARRKLLDNFDAEVHEKLRVNLQKGREYLNKYEQWLWNMTRHYVGTFGKFNDRDYTFQVFNNPFRIPKGYFRLIRHGTDVPVSAKKDMPEYGYTVEKNDHFNGDFHIYRVGHPLAQSIIEHYKTRELPPRELTFQYTQDRRTMHVLEQYVGQSGFLRVTQLTIESFETEDHLVLSGITHGGVPLDHDACHRLFDLQATEDDRPLRILPETMRDLEVATKIAKDNILENSRLRNMEYLDNESWKLDKWADDLKLSLEREITALDEDIRLRRSLSRKCDTIEDKAKMQQEIREMERHRNELRHRLFEAQDEVEHRRDALLDELEQRAIRKITETEVFTIRWRLV